MFENAEIALDQIPRADDVEWQMLDARFKRMHQAACLLFMIPIAVALTLVTLLTPIPVAPAVVMWINWALITAFWLVWPLIAYPKRGYVVRDKDLLFRKGVIWRSVTAVPFNRIQHVETSHSPLDRKFGLATLAAVYRWRLPAVT